MNSKYLHHHSQSRNYVTARYKRCSAALSGAYQRPSKHLNLYICYLRRPFNPHIYKGRPIRSLTVPRRKNGGRDQHGCYNSLTSRWRTQATHTDIGLQVWSTWLSVLNTTLVVQPTVASPSYITTTQMLSTNKNGATYIIATDSEGLRAGDQFERFRRGIPEGFILGFDSKTLTTSRTIGRIFSCSR